MSDLIEALKAAGFPSAKADLAFFDTVLPLLDPEGNPTGNEVIALATRAMIAADRDAVLRVLLEARLAELDFTQICAIDDITSEWYVGIAARDRDIVNREKAALLSLLAPEGTP